MTVATPVGNAPQSPQPPQPGPGANVSVEAKVRGESRFDQVSSLLMAFVVGAGLVVGLLWLVYITDTAFATKVTSSLEIIEVYGGGGGSPEGELGSTEKIDIAGAEVADRASNNEEDASAFEEASVQEAPAVMLDAAAEAGESMAEVDVGAVMPSGGPVASGKRASKLGTGGPGLGFGPGDGGVRREDRWSIVYPPGQTQDEYARQLDALGVELATISGKQMVYASQFSAATPTRRSGSGQSDKRLYFVWQGGTRKASDVALLKKAGIDVGEAPIFQFYPGNVENILKELEVRYRGRQPAEIKKTRFSVVPSSGGGYGFVVQSQELLR
jgi:rhodanese-related sulfurtransferase